MYPNDWRGWHRWLCGQSAGHSRLWPGSIPAQVVIEVSLFCVLFSLKPRRFSGFSAVFRHLLKSTLYGNICEKIVNIGVVSVREKSPQLAGHYTVWLDNVETIKIYSFYWCRPLYTSKCRSAIHQSISPSKTSFWSHLVLCALRFI